MVQLVLNLAGDAVANSGGAYADDYFHIFMFREEADATENRNAMNGSYCCKFFVHQETDTFDRRSGVSKRLDNLQNVTTQATCAKYG